MPMRPGWTRFMYNRPTGKAGRSRLAGQLMQTASPFGWGWVGGGSCTRQLVYLIHGADPASSAFALFLQPGQAPSIAALRRKKMPLWAGHALSANATLDGDTYMLHMAVGGWCLHRSCSFTRKGIDKGGIPIAHWMVGSQTGVSKDVQARDGPAEIL